MTTDTTTVETTTPDIAPIETSPSSIAHALAGKSARATTLHPGTAYIMRAWHRPDPIFSQVTFTGFGRMTSKRQNIYSNYKHMTSNTQHG